jgi:DNA-binding transcriptional LysR family regulator
MGSVIEFRSFLGANAQHSVPVSGLAPEARRQLVRGPELGELRALCAAADLGSITRAAGRLNVSQPALSKRLRGLEAVAGTMLLQRSSRGVTLTVAGKRLYGAARRVLAEADSVEMMMCEFVPHSEPVRVAASPTIAELWLPPLLVELKIGCERQLSVEIATANSGAVRRMVREGQSDIGLAAVDPGEPCEAGLAQTVIWASEVVVAVPAGHPWAARDEIEPEEFARTRVIRSEPAANSSRVVEAGLESIGLSQVPPLAEIGSTTAAVAIARAIGAPVLLPASTVPDHAAAGLVARRVRGLRFERQFALLVAGSLDLLRPSARLLAEHLLASRHDVRVSASPGVAARAADAGVLLAS